MAGVDLNLPSAGGGASKMVQQDPGAMAAPYSALRGAGQAVARAGSVVMAVEKQRQANAMELEKERQKLHDSTMEAAVRRQASMADTNVAAAIEAQPGDASAWQREFDGQWNEVMSGFEKAAETLSPEARQKQLDFLLSERTKSAGALKVRIVGAEVKARNDGWKLNAAMAADEHDRESFDEAIANVSWSSDAEREKFARDTWSKGKYNQINNEMLALESPEELSKFSEAIVSDSASGLDKGQRNYLSMVAKQRAVKVSSQYNATMRDFQRRIKRGDEITVDEINEKIATNQIDPARVELIQAQVEEAAKRSDYMARYNLEVALPTFTRASDEIVKGYLTPKKNAKGEIVEQNVAMSEEDRRAMIASIDKLNLGAFAKGDLYALAFAAQNEALQEPDHGWGWGIGANRDRIGDEERAFRLAYTRDLNKIMGQGEVVMDGLARQFLANDDEITKYFASDKKPEDEAKFRERMLKPIISGMMNAELRNRLMSSAPAGGVREGQTATNPATGEKLVFRNGSWQKAE